jgi:hypothetical protein
MADQDLSIVTPSISRSASIATIGKDWGVVGPTGAASFVLPIPSSAGRGWDPQLSLSYSSQTGNGSFGIGWGVGLAQISRRTHKGVPRYTDLDEIVGHDGEVCRPEFESDGSIKSRQESQYNGVDIGLHEVVRYWPEVESDFTLREYWKPVADQTPFWLIHGADGSLQVYGKTPSSRIADPDDPQRVSAWLICESLNSRGEHICYEYKADEKIPGSDDDPSAQRYLQRVWYGNAEANADLYAWSNANPADMSWHFHLLFDYGERSTAYPDKPAYVGDKPWLLRKDTFSTYGQGFEVGTQRLCQQVLMFHHFPLETGPDPVLVRRLLLEYSNNPQTGGYSLLSAAHYQAYDSSAYVENTPPVEFDYSPFVINKSPSRLFESEAMPGIDTGTYRCVDLYGEGAVGFLCSYNNAWYYREPVRESSGPDAIGYTPWTLLEKIPVANSQPNARQILTDQTGDGRLDWITVEQGISGYNTLNADRRWTAFTAFRTFPAEYLHTLAQLGDLSGDGLSSIALIGPHSVRLYANRREEGFAKAEEVDHTPDRLPLFGPSRSQLVMLGNLRGTDMPELFSISHDQIKCWPNLGHGTFAHGRVISSLPFTYGQFDSDRVRIADLDGSGAPALLYLNSEGFDIYLNRAGNGFEQTPIHVPWPQDVRYDPLCQVTVADLQGLGCESLILTVAHSQPQHWRYDFVSAKPYLLTASNNNMGCSASVSYRSSAQEWLDEKTRRLAEQPTQTPACYLPFPIQVVSRQSQLDEITGNCTTQLFRYAEGFYDGKERMFRGFGFVEQTDSESASPADDASFTAPVRVCSWFHTGQSMDRSREGYFKRDADAVALGRTVFSQYHPSDECDVVVTPPEDAHDEIARALAGSIARIETYAADADPAVAAPFSVQETRYLIREVRPKGSHDAARVLLPMALEQINYAYDRFIDDPLCTHDITLCRNAYGLPTHDVTVSYARRLTEASPPPFTDPDHQQWWRDAHDPAQQSYYLKESRARFIDLNQNPQQWRLGLTFQQRGNALVLPKGSLPEGLSPAQVSYEHLIEHQGSLHWQTERVLTTQSVQRYLKTFDQSPLPDGEAEFAALPGPLELAQMDKTALDAYSELANFDIRAQLTRIGYTPMPFLFKQTPEDDSARNLWSSRYNFARYAGPEGFYKVQAFNETPSHGVTTAEYDAYRLAVTQVVLPDGCTTHARYDYLHQLPEQITDANDNIEEVIYLPSGQPLAVSFYGTENSVPAGFKPLSEYQLPTDPDPAAAIEHPAEAVQKAASTLRKNLFSWMGNVLPDVSTEQLLEWIGQRHVLPSGHIRASARLQLARSQFLTPAQQLLSAAVAAAARDPVHSVMLSADRYPDDTTAAQIHIVKACVDGFGRPLQTQQRVDPGLAYVVAADGSLVIENGQLLEALADPRWRISERIDYNNKGLPIRQYRAFFANVHGYVNDHSLRECGFYDQLFYDELGRLIKVINATGDFSRETYHPWYKTSEDANDTAEPAPANPSRTLH